MDSRKLSKNAFFAFLFLFPFQTVLLLREPMIGGEKWQYGTIGLYGTDILLLIAIFFFVIASRFWEKIEDLRLTIFESEDWVSRLFILKSKIILHKSFAALALLLLWSGLSILWAPDQVLAGYFFVKLLLGVGAFFLARSLDDGGMRTVVKVLLAAVVIQAVLGIGQFLAQSTFSSSLLGMSAHESWQAGTSVLKNESGRWLRAYGSFPHPNMLGGFLATILVAGISYLVSSIAYKENTKYIIRNTRYRLLMYHASLILILLGLILTFSRTAWLGAILGIAVLLVMVYREGGKNGNGENAKKIIADQKSMGYIILRPWNYVPLFRWVLVLGLAVVVFVFVLRDQVFPRFDAATIGREGSVSERIQSLADAKGLIAAHPFLGVGAGNFTAAVRGQVHFSSEENMYLPPSRPEKVLDPFIGRPVWTIQPAHNVFVLIFAELGAVGLFLFAGFLLSVLMMSFRWLWQFGGRMQDVGCRMSASEEDLSCIIYHASFILALFALLPSLFLDHWLWSSHFGLFLFFLLAGLVARR
jgi:O-antigen ligase